MTGDGLQPLGVESPGEVDMTIDEAVDRIERVIDELEQGDVSLGTGKALYEEAGVLLEYVNEEASIDGGAVEEVSP